LTIKRIPILVLGVVAVIYISVTAGRMGQFDQPIDFNHNKHSIELEIECQFCHQTVEENDVAGIPNIEVCNFCHEEGVVSENPRFQEVVEIIREHARQGTKIAWNRIYRVPDHVIFSHRIHVAASVECVNCHGETGTAKHPAGELDLISMNSCLDCHLTNNVSTDCLTCHK
jgi:hypothetical protein